jgi:ABC-type lipoprotein release transport system permease subunit
MAAQLWPGADALGKRIRIGSDENAPWTAVVGIVGRVKQYTLDSESRIALYVPHAQFPTRALNIVVRSAGRPEDLSAAVRAQLRALDPDLPVYNVRTMEQRVGESLARRRFSMLLLTLFAALALGLAALGVYSVVAYSVSQGMRELGIRVALGATPKRILSFVVGQTMAVAAIGIAAGIGAALVATRWLHAMLFGIDARDPATFLSVVGLLALVALLASGLPAARGARVDAAAVMRE